MRGELHDQSRKIVYDAVTFYPPGGRLYEHRDVDPAEIVFGDHVHFMVPLTKFGEDFHSGGLTITEPTGMRTQLDRLASLGDVIFFDGSCSHAVEEISGELGRISIFSIPTSLKNSTPAASIFLRSIKFKLKTLAEFFPHVGRALRALKRRRVL